MIDISTLNPLFLQIPLLLLLVLGLLSGLKDGIIKKLIDFAFYIILIIAMIYFVPPLAKQVESSGIIQNFVLSHLEGDLANTIISVLSGPVYVALTSSVIFLVVIIVKFFLNFILNRIFKKGLINRSLGAVWQLAINFFIAAGIMAVIASPSIFKGGDKLLTSTPGVKEVYGGVTKVQEVLKEHNLPYDLESLFGKVLAGKDATPEDIARYQKTLQRLPEIIDTVGDPDFANKMMDNLVDSNGNINQEYANNLLDDFIVVSELVNNLPIQEKEKICKPLVDMFEAGKNEVIDADGNPVSTIDVTEEQKATLNEACKNLGIADATINEFNKCLIVK